MGLGNAHIHHKVGPNFSQRALQVGADMDAGEPQLVGGALGHGIAELFGSDPERVIGEDLARVATHLRGTRPAVGETGQRR